MTGNKCKGHHGDDFNKPEDTGCKWVPSLVKDLPCDSGKEEAPSE
jgi:hypothetical protein